MAREWLTCECGAEWREEQDDECPYCKANKGQAMKEAADEWKREQMKDAQYEDLGLDPRESEYWDGLP